MRLCKTPRHQACQLETTSYTFTHRQNISEQDVQSMTCFIKGSKSALKCGHKELKKDITCSYVFFCRLYRLPQRARCVLRDVEVFFPVCPQHPGCKHMVWGLQRNLWPSLQLPCVGEYARICPARWVLLCVLGAVVQPSVVIKNIYIHITCQTVKSSNCLFKCLWFKKVNKSTSFLEAAARCKGVSKPWSLEFTFAPVIESKIKNKFFSCRLFVSFSPYAVIETSLVYLHL